MTDDIEIVIAQAAIAQVLYQYARGIDRQDWDLVCSCYHDDAFDDHGAYKGNARGLVEWVAERHKTIPVSMHLITNVLIEVDGTQARSEAYCITRQRVEADGRTIDTTVGVRYLDRFEQRGGPWKIAHRRVVFEFSRIDPVIETTPFGPDWVVATRDASDPSYDHSAEA
jgi:3-phenylpropionate/cinnamic acid dioxygenase small subunit